MFKFKWLNRLLLLCVFLYTDMAVAKTLVVGVIAQYPPYTFYSQNSSEPTGIGMDIWKEIAERLDITDYQYVALDSNFSKHVEELSQGKYDLIISPLFVTKKRYELVDFSATLAVAPTVILLKKQGLSFLNAFYFFAKSSVIYFVLGYLALFLVYAHGLWFLERGKTMSKRYKKFIESAIWVLLLSGKMDDLPKRWSANMLIFLWQIVGYIVLSLLISFGTVAALELTTHLFQDVETLNDLRGKRIAAEEGAQEYYNAQRAGLSPIAVHSYKEALQLINKGELDGIAIDKAEAQYLINTMHLDDFYVTPVVISRNLMGFPVAKHHDQLLSNMNKIILDLQAEGYTSYICSRYLSLESTLCIGN